VHVLVVEDDARIASFLEKGLRSEGYATTTAASGADASTYLETQHDEFDLVLLDLGLPDGSGLDVLRRLRKRDASMPVVVLTARAEVADKVAGLDLGANDYVTKPFSFEELVARIRAAVRSSGQPTATELVVGDLRLDLLTKLAWRAGRLIELAPREWALLELFMRHPTHVLTRARILNQVWEYGFDPGSNVVDVYVGYLRRKLNRPGLLPLIRTVRGAGYRLLPPAGGSVAVDGTGVDGAGSAGGTGTDEPD
jgi:DNA-binding response OmpR family regulator